MKENLTCSIFIKDGCVEINASNGEVDVSYKGDPKLNSNENNAISAIAATIKALHSGKNIDYFFNPTKDPDGRNKLMRCKWTKAGTLQVLKEAETIRWKHAATVHEALLRQRVFTCTKEVFEELPNRKQLP